MVPREVKPGAGRHAAYYIGSLSLGGAEHVMANLAEALFLRGWRITFVTTYAAEQEYELPHALWRRDDAEACPEDGETTVTARTLITEQPLRMRIRQGDGIGRVFSGIPAAEAGGRIRGFITRRRRLKEIWQDLQPDVILSFIGKNNLMALSTAGRIPVVVSVRATPLEEYPTAGMRLSAKLLFPRAAAVAVQTKAAGAWFSRAVEQRAVVIPNEIAAEFLMKRPRRQDADPGRTRVIAGVGRLDANKNFAMLIRAVARLHLSHPAHPVRLVLYGDGEDREKLEKLTDALGIADEVRFAGQTTRIAEELAGADIFCLTSGREGMPNALIEAMCLGLPCITTDCLYGGIGQLVHDGEDAVVIPAGDEDALVAALERLLGDPALCARLGAAAERMRDEHLSGHVTDLWERVLAAAADRQEIQADRDR